MSNEDDFYELYDDIPRQLPGVIEALEIGGGQTCDVAGILRLLPLRGFEIARKGQAESALSIIHDCQNILSEHLPSNGPDCKTTISRLLAILDGPRWRALDGEVSK